MIVFEILINGTRYGESQDISAVTVVAERVLGRPSDRVTVHGQSLDGHAQWLDSHLSIGDEIRIRITEASGAGTDPGGCHFCGREASEIPRLIQGRSVAICDQCTTHFADALKSSSALPIGASIHDAPNRGCDFCGQHGHEVGGLIVGDVPTFRLDQMPYGGVKNSGLGREGLRYSIEDMTERKLMVMAVK